MPHDRGATDATVATWDQDLRRTLDMTQRDCPDGTKIVSAELPDGAREVRLEADGRAVSRTLIIPLLIRIGAAVVRMDGIGGVATEEAYRNRGYSRRVLETAVETMRAGNAALTTLYGIQDLYPKFGYATAGPEYTVALRLDDASAATASLPPHWIVRPFAAADLPAVMRLYHANTRRATGAVVRHDAGDESAETRSLTRASPAAVQIGRRSWDHLHKPGPDAGEETCRVVLDPSGAIVAYAWLGARNWSVNYRRQQAPDAFHVAEAMAANPAAADAVLAACRRWTAEAGNDHAILALAMPPDGPVATAAAFASGYVLARQTRAGDFMARVLDIGRLLTQLRPELDARVRAARVGYRGRLTLRTDEGEASLAVTPDGGSGDDGPGGPGLVVELPQATLARLCFGAFDPGDLVARLPNPPSRDAVALVAVLFPRRYPHIYPMDRF